MIDNFSNDIYSANIYFFWIYSSNKRQISALDSRIKSPGARLYLQPPYTGTYINIRKLPAGFMNISRKMFLHANRRTAAPDISRQRKKFFHRYQITLLLPEAFAASFRSTSCSPGMTQTK